VSYETRFPEGAGNKASKGFSYLFGGFCIWGDDPITTEGFKPKLTAILSANVKGSSRRLMCECGGEAFATPSKINHYSLMV